MANGDVKNYVLKERVYRGGENEKRLIPLHMPHLLMFHKTIFHQFLLRNVQNWRSKNRIKNRSLRMRILTIVQCNPFSTICVLVNVSSVIITHCTQCVHWTQVYLKRYSTEGQTHVPIIYLFRQWSWTYWLNER